jgi:hypothetical protein
MKRKLIIVLVLIYFYTPLFCQTRSLSLNLGFGYAKANQDYSFLIGNYGMDVIRYAKSHIPNYDYEIFVNANKEWKLIGNNLKFTTGAGFSTFVNTFGLPVSNKYFGIKEYIFITNNSYYNHSLQIPMSLRVNVLKYFSIGPSFIYNLSLIKHVNPVNLGNVTDNLTVASFTSNSMHGLISSSISVNKLRLNLDYGLWSGKWRDDALANDGIGFSTNKRRYIRMSVGYYIK